MNNTTIIIRIHFAVTLFQHSPLTRRVFYNSIGRERGQQYQVGERTTSSISSWNTNWHIYKSSEVFFLIINIAQKLEHHQHSTEAGASSTQHGARVASSSSSA
jgi:hypothetical protein